MPPLDSGRIRPAVFRVMAILLGGCIAASPAMAGDTAQLDTRSGRREVRLWPPDEPGDDRPSKDFLDWGGWHYRAVKAPNPRDGVPWQLLVTPTGEQEAVWKKGSMRQRLPFAVAERSRVDTATKYPEAIPVIETPDHLWKQWMDSDLQDVVGIHFHELVSDDQARILFTLHKVPPDPPDGSDPGPAGPQVETATRIEATLLAPVTYSLDQTIFVRADPHDKSKAKSRGEHEAGHAQLSQDVLVAVLGGPQDWDATRCVGRRSQVAYYWKREQIGRSWDGYRGGVGKALALRTSVVLVPPTRWSMLLPVPPERVTAKHLEQFNKRIVDLAARFAAADRTAQEQFHAEHGSFEREARR